MLRALNRYGTGPEGCAQAWLSLPHSTRVFYPHAYCSRWAARTSGWLALTVLVMWSERTVAAVQRFKSGLDAYEFIRLVQATASSEDIPGF